MNEYKFVYRNIANKMIAFVPAPSLYLALQMLKDSENRYTIRVESVVKWRSNI